jgi:hypothetical protein
MAARWHHHDAIIARQNRYARMSPDHLLRQMLELFGKMHKTFTQSAETTRQFHASLTIQLELLPDLVHEDATTARFKTAAPAYGLPRSKSFPTQLGSFNEPRAKLEPIQHVNSTPTLLDTELLPTTLPHSVGRILERAADTFDVLHQHCVLHDVVADSITAGSVALSTPIRTLNTSPLPLATTLTAKFQIRRYLVFWNSTVILKHRWRWKLSC